MSKEKDIQKTIISWLTIQENAGKLIFLRFNSFSGQIIRANSSKGYVKNNKKGAPDIIIFLPNGNYLCAEIKGYRCRLSSDQMAFKDKVDTLCGYYQVIYSLDELIITIDLING